MCLVYVLNKNGLPLMPTHKFGKVRYLLKSKKAKIIKRSPFTIQLLYETTNYTQEITLGVDSGSKHIGLSASTKTNELFCSDVTLRNDIVELLSTRRENRRTRRNRLRYRKARFNNRVSTKRSGWLAPSVNQKVETHLKVIENVYKILPISKLIVEVASFDIQLLKALENDEIISETDYQNGEMTGWNTREYVLFRDNHTCQYCKGKSKDNVLEVHHLESRKIGGNAPNNLITLCKTCHKKYHKGEIELKQKRVVKFNDATFMGVMRWVLYNELKTIYQNVELTYGYITKSNRIKCNLTKEHYNDAYCIANNLEAKPLDYVYYQRKIRCHNRQIHKSNIFKGNRKKLKQAPYIVKNFRLFDKVLFEKQECFIFGRRSSGFFDIRKLDGTKINSSISFRKLLLVEHRKNILSIGGERRFLSKKQ